jgi:hypothetical protein
LQLAGEYSSQPCLISTSICIVGSGQGSSARRHSLELQRHTLSLLLFARSSTSLRLRTHCLEFTAPVDLRQICRDRLLLLRPTLWHHETAEAAIFACFSTLSSVGTSTCGPRFALVMYVRRVSGASQTTSLPLELLLLYKRACQREALLSSWLPHGIASHQPLQRASSIPRELSAPRRSSC